MDYLKQILYRTTKKYQKKYGQAVINCGVNSEIAMLYKSIISILRKEIISQADLDDDYVVWSDSKNEMELQPEER